MGVCVIIDHVDASPAKPGTLRPPLRSPEMDKIEATLREERLSNRTLEDNAMKKEPIRLLGCFQMTVITYYAWTKFM